jgi:hypothetical protein
MMGFYAVLDQVLALLRQRGRVTYRALKLQFKLDDESRADLLRALTPTTCWRRRRYCKSCPSSAVTFWRSYDNRWRRVSYCSDLAGILDGNVVAAPAARLTTAEDAG